jgi:hypothetical protein
MGKLNKSIPMAILQKWLEEHGVRTEFNTSVTNLGFCHNAEGFKVERIFVYGTDTRMKSG